MQEPDTPMAWRASHAQVRFAAGWARSTGRRHLSTVTTAEQATVALDLCEIERLTMRALLRAGAAEEHASAVADVVMRAEQGQQRCVFAKCTECLIQTELQHIVHTGICCSQMFSVVLALTVCSCVGGGGGLRWVDLTWALSSARLCGSACKRQSAGERSAQADDGHTFAASL